MGREKEKLWWILLQVIGIKTFHFLYVLFLNCHLMYERLVGIWLGFYSLNDIRNEKDKLNSMENFKDKWQVKNNISPSHCHCVFLTFDHWNTLTHNVRFGKCSTMAKATKKGKILSIFQFWIFSIISESIHVYISTSVHLKYRHIKQCIE